MKNNFITETLVSIVLVVTLLIIVNPSNIFMPSMVQITVACIALFVFGLFASLVLREKAEDEREVLHRGLAGRNAFLVGSAVILLGILFGEVNHEVDPWLVTALVSMILTKVISRIYSDRKF